MLSGPSLREPSYLVRRTLARSGTLDPEIAEHLGQPELIGLINIATHFGDVPKILVRGVDLRTLADLVRLPPDAEIEPTGWRMGRESPN